MVDAVFPVIEQFVVKLYGIQDEAVDSVDSARAFLFFKKARDFEKMPPSSDALKQHVRRTAYQVR